MAEINKQRIPPSVMFANIFLSLRPSIGWDGLTYLFWTPFPERGLLEVQKSPSDHKSQNTGWRFSLGEIIIFDLLLLLLFYFRIQKQLRPLILSQPQCLLLASSSRGCSAIKSVSSRPKSRRIPFYFMLHYERFIQPSSSCFYSHLHQL